MLRTRVVVVIDRRGELVDHTVIKGRDTNNADAYYEELAQAKQALQAKYVYPDYRVHEAVAENVGDLRWAYPEIFVSV